MKLFLNCFFFLIALNTFSQSIIAGKHNSSDYFYDVNPDTTMISVYAHFGSGYAPVYPIDINNDGIVDFQLRSSGGGGNGGGGSTTSISASANSQIAFGNSTMCISPIDTNYNYRYDLALSLFYNDTIDSNMVWKSSYLPLCGYYWQINNGINCNYCSFGSGDQYIGVRVFTCGDTLYGWIKVNSVTTGQFTLLEYACNKSFNINLSCTESTVLIGKDTIVCANVSGGKPPYKYTWLPEGGNASCATIDYLGLYTVTIEDSSGCVSKASITFKANPNSSINPTTKNSQYLLYPNPASNTININGIKSKSTINLYDVFNKLVMTNEVNDDATIETTQLTSGVYTIVVINNGSKSYNKVVILR